MWNFEDVLDLFYFFHADEDQGSDEEKLHHRDRHFYLNSRQQAESTIPDRHQCLALWLKNRRAAELQGTDPFVPGDAIRQTLAFFRFILFLGGILLGCSLALSYFVYTGQTPLNVFHFLVIFILPQLLFITLLAVQGLFALKKSARPSALTRLLTTLFTQLFLLLQKRLFARLPASKRTGITGILTREHGALSYWPLFLGSQLFGIGLNIGILGVTMLKIATTDLAFGWQSTLHLGPENLYSLVRIIATPWSWLLPANLAFPSLMEIEGSRIILKDGTLHLLTANLTSWWPFLLLSLLVYGLLPRIILSLFGLSMEWRAIRQQLGKTRYDAIVKRMLTPLVTTQAPPAPKASPEETTVATGRESRSLPDEGETTAALVLIPDDFFDLLDATILTEMLRPHRVFPKDRKRIFQSYGADVEVLAAIAKGDWNGLAGIIIILEAWTVPLQEHIHLFQSIIDSVPDEVDIALFFLGRVDSPFVPTPAREDDLRMWRQKLAKLHRTLAFLEPIHHDTQGRQIPS
jgi:hypothetical protein